jgi:hypothetical protein
MPTVHVDKEELYRALGRQYCKFLQEICVFRKYNAESILILRKILIELFSHG